MQAFIGATLLASKEAHPQSKPFEIYDNRLSGFMLRVQPSGTRSYYARFGRNRRVVLGRVNTLAPEEARERCQKVLGNVAHGYNPLHGISGNDGMTLGMFIAERTPLGSTRAAHKPRLTRLRSCIDISERGIRSPSPPSPSNASSRGRRGV